MGISSAYCWKKLDFPLRTDPARQIQTVFSSDHWNGLACIRCPSHLQEIGGSSPRRRTPSIALFQDRLLPRSPSPRLLDKLFLPILVYRSLVISRFTFADRVYEGKFPSKHRLGMVQRQTREGRLVETANTHYEKRGGSGFMDHSCHLPSFQEILQFVSFEQ